MLLILFYRALFGIFASLIIGFFAYLTKQLTRSGTMALIFIGVLLTTIGSWPTWVLIVLFFLSSGGIHLVKKQLFPQIGDSIAEKGATRDAKQVLANSLPALVSLVFYFSTANELFLIGYAAGIAGAASDTWASEIGVLSHSSPRSILTLKKLPPGTSGGITILGTVASFSASFLLSVSFWFLISITSGFSLVSFSYFLVPFFSGVLASIFDSLLGAGLQARYECSVCHQWTEKTIHHGKQTTLIKGLRFLDNDWVNLISGFLTVVTSWGLYFFIHP